MLSEQSGRALASPPPEFARWRERALETARLSGDADPDSIKVVATTLHAVDRLFSNLPAGENGPVWLVQIRGDFIFTGPHPPDVPPFRGHWIWLTTPRGAPQVDGFGAFDDKPRDISQLGTVIQLYP